MKGLVFGRFLGIAALVGAVGLVGCADETSATEGSDDAAEGVAQAPIVDQATPGAAGARPSKEVATKDRARERGERGDQGDRDPHAGPGHRGGKHGRGHGGPEQLLRAAIDELDLNGAQKATIEGALADLEASRPERPEPGAAGESPFAAIADQVRKGSIDAAGVEAAFAKHRPDRAEHHAAVTKALGTLHATLTGAQRRELVDAVTARMDEREKAFAAKHGERDAEDASARGPRGERRRGEGRRGDHRGGPLEHLVGDLDLRGDQQAKVDAILAGLAPSDADREAFEEKHATMKKEMRARLESFASDRFDAAAALPPKDAMKPDHHAKMAQALAAIVPVLDPAQREALAERLEEGPMGRHGRHGGKGGRSMRGGAR